jgi:hypothetical protein
MPILARPKIDDVDLKTGNPKYASFAEYEAARDAWNFRRAMFGFAIIALLAYAGRASFLWTADVVKGHSTAKANSKWTDADTRDVEIADLKAKVATLEAKPKAEHHYEFRDRGYRTWRFDPASGASCIELTTKADWKKPETVRQGCQYQDWVNGDGATMKDYLAAECQLVDNKKACDQFMTLASK